MAIHLLKEAADLNLRMCEENDRFVREFQAVVARLETGRRSMMQHASKLKTLRRPPQSASRTVR